MKKTTRPSDSLLRPEQKNAILKAIISHMYDEFEVEIGLIAAETHLDFIVETIGAPLYNKGVEDARMTLHSHSENLEINLNSLLRS